MSDEKVRPDVLQAALLEEMAERLFKLQKFLEEGKPLGVVWPIEPIVVTDAQDGRLIKCLYNKPWFCVEMTNDGPNDVWAIVNTEKNEEWHLIRVGEIYKVDMKRPIIKDVLLRCDLEKTASVRLVGSR